jgi:hypothetical protein
VSQRAADTRLALVKAFKGPGLPTNAFPDLDTDELDHYVGELALAYLEMLPRNVRRPNPDVLTTTLVRAIGLGFWAGAAYVVERDRS